MTDSTPPTSKTPLTIIEATPAHITSLTTIVARAFHLQNAYIREAVPDTPEMRQWWAASLRSSIPEPNAWILTATAPTRSPNDANLQPNELPAAGILLCRAYEPMKGDASPVDDFFARYPVTHERGERERSMNEELAKNATRARDELMRSHAYVQIELLGVDEAWKGHGVGGGLLRRACSIAEERGLEVFVQANVWAKPFYAREGFEVIDVKTMPGEHEYVEYVMLRPAPGKKVD